MTESFTAASGSSYEVDRSRRRVRRVGNAAGRPTTARRGADASRSEWLPMWPIEREATVLLVTQPLARQEDI
jgi:hypothetical protein